MKINIQKGLFRIYKVLNILVVIFALLGIIGDEVFQYQEWMVLAGYVAFTLLALLTPWAIHFFVKWIISGFKEEEKDIALSVKEEHPEDISESDIIDSDKFGSKALSLAWKCISIQVACHILSLSLGEDSPVVAIANLAYLIASAVNLAAIIYAIRGLFSDKPKRKAWVALAIYAIYITLSILAVVVIVAITGSYGDY